MPKLIKEAKRPPKVTSMPTAKDTLTEHERELASAITKNLEKRPKEKAPKLSHASKCPPLDPSDKESFTIGGRSLTSLN